MGKMAVMTVVAIVIMTVAGCGESKGEVKPELTNTIKTKKFYNNDSYKQYRI